MSGSHSWLVLRHSPRGHVSPVTSPGTALEVLVPSAPNVGTTGRNNGTIWYDVPFLQGVQHAQKMAAPVMFGDEKLRQWPCFQVCTMWCWAVVPRNAICLKQFSFTWISQIFGLRMERCGYCSQPVSRANCCSRRSLRSSLKLSARYLLKSFEILCFVLPRMSLHILLRSVALRTQTTWCGFFSAEIQTEPLAKSA